LVGLAAYRRRNGRLVFTHTEVDKSQSGRGFGSRLAAAALDDARRQGLEVVPLCPFMAHFIDEHPEYEPLVAAGYRERTTA
jgi:predicted GNAT family acetyltransferase